MVVWEPGAKLGYMRLLGLAALAVRATPFSAFQPSRLIDRYQGGLLRNSLSRSHGRGSRSQSGESFAWNIDAKGSPSPLKPRDARTKAGI